MRGMAVFEEGGISTRNGKVLFRDLQKSGYSPDGRESTVVARAKL